MCIRPAVGARPSFGLFALLLAGLTGCTADRLEQMPVVGTMEFALSKADGQQPTATAGGFAFLPPMVDSAMVSGTFEPKLAITVRIEQLSGGTAAGSTIAEWSPTTPQKVRVNDSGQNYYVDWHTKSAGLAVGSVYRVHVLVPGRELGYADVVIVGKSADLKKKAPTQVALVEGQTLQIKFYVAVGYVDEDLDGDFDYADVCPTIADPDQLDTDGDGIGNACECAAVTCAAGPCSAAGACDSTTGQCVAAAFADGTACDDGDGCTVGDACAAGQCLGTDCGDHASCVGGTAGNQCQCDAGYGGDGVTCEQVLFESVFGGFLDDHAKAVQPLADGGHIVAGYKRSATGSEFDLWLVRFDQGGHVLWDRTYGGAAVDVGMGVLALADGGFAVAGYTGSQGNGQFDMWLLRTDGAGDPLWDRTFGGTKRDIALAIEPTADGGFALAGGTESSGQGSWDFWLVVTDAEGNLTWDRTWGGAGEEYAYDLVRSTDGGWALAGYTRSFGSGAQDMWLVRADALGQPLWEATYGGAGNDLARSLVELPDGGWVLAGVTASKGAGGNDAWIVRTDAAGALAWDATYGGVAEDVAAAVVASPDGGFALAGHTGSQGAGMADGWLARIDAEGAPMWEKLWGGADADSFQALAHTADGGYVLAGQIRSSGAGRNDGWLVRTDADGKSTVP